MTRNFPFVIEKKKKTMSGRFKMPFFFISCIFGSVFQLLFLLFFILGDFFLETFFLVKFSLLRIVIPALKVCNVTEVINYFQAAKTNGVQAIKRKGFECWFLWLENFTPVNYWRNKINGILHSSYVRQLTRISSCIFYGIKTKKQFVFFV